MNRHVALGLALILLGLVALTFVGCAALDPDPFACDRAPSQVRAMTAARPITREIRYAHVVDCGVAYREAWGALDRQTTGALAR